MYPKRVTKRKYSEKNNLHGESKRFKHSDITNDEGNQFRREYNFRSIPVCPDATDLAKRPSLPKNNINEKYKDGADQYLDTQFRLLREDFIRPLREGIEEYKQLVLNRQASGVIRIQNVNVYKNVSLISSYITRNGDLIHWAKFDLRNFKGMNREVSTSNDRNVFGL